MITPFRLTVRVTHTSMPSCGASTRFRVPAGTRKRVEAPHDGMDVWVTRTVRRNGVIIHQETIFSDYARVNGELWIGVAPTATPTPTPTPSALSTTTVWA